MIMHCQQLLRLSGWVAPLLGACCPFAQAADDGALLRIRQSGTTIESFVPPQHRIAVKVEADFDGDGLRDAALLVVPDCKELAESSPLEREQCEADGRMLVVVFRQAKGGYRLSIAKEIPSGVGNHGDHFEGMKLRGRTLSFGGGGSSCAGGSGGEQSYQFRYQAGEWVLIGTTQSSWMRSTECGGEGFDRNRNFCPELELGRGEVCVEVSRSANFNTSIQESTWSIQPTGSGRAEQSERTVVQRKRFDRKPLVRMTDIALEF
ncbi:MAG TPA: hypothetical protein VGI48_00405 [Caldimonas sp.]|jgi:hypothetical protein